MIISPDLKKNQILPLAFATIIFVIVVSFYGNWEIDNNVHSSSSSVTAFSTTTTTTATVSQQQYTNVVVSLITRHRIGIRLPTTSVLMHQIQCGSHPSSAVGTTRLGRQQLESLSFIHRSLQLHATSSLSRSSDNGSNTDSNNTVASSATLSHDEETTTAALTTTTPSSTMSATTSGLKLRRLKDMMWIRETLEDLTAAEFACTVETAATSGASSENSSNNNNKVDPSSILKNIASSANTKLNEMTKGTATSSITTTTTTSTATPINRPRKRAVDYEKLLRQLNQRLRDLGCTSDMDNNDYNTDEAQHQYTLQPDVGMGTLTYTEIQRNALLDRIVRTRTQLIEIIHGNQIEMSDTESIPSFLQKNLPSLPRMEIPKEDVGEDVLSPKLYVRDDGTVDWDGALSSGAALRQFGTAVWARINGRETTASIDDTDDGDINNNTTAILSSSNTINNDTKNIQLHGTASTQVTAKIVETESIIEARETLNALRDQLNSMEREHYKLLNSVISQGQATANVKLATLAPKVRGEIQASAAALENIKVRVSFQTLLYELERIYTYLMGELGNPSLNGYIPLQDRLNVAEFGLLESQVDTFNRQFMENDTIDEDVLAVVFEQLTDFKRRLGIDYYVAGLSFDREAIGAWLGDLWVKTKKGLAFYVKGVRLFWNDVVFCLRLINRAAQGYTLKPREVRTIRRTFKDVITFIPFVIILLIPLSPIGHVLVFGAIQRFFPDFFPSCFTEQRQNLLQLYETAEYSEMVINENWNAKLSRIAVAMAYVVADAFRTFFLKLTGGLRRPDLLSDDSESNKKQ